MNRTFARMLVATMAGAFALSLSAAAAAQATMKMASATINDVQHQWLKRFEAEIAPKTAGKLKIEIYPASQLGPIPRMVEGVVLGSIEAFVTPYSFLVGTDPRFQIFDAVGVFRSADHLNSILADDAYRKHVLAMSEQKGLKTIGVFNNSPTIVLSKKPIRTLADFKGQKLRVFATPLQIEPMKLLGATPVPMALNEVLPAMQSGNIDGLLAGMPILTAFKYYDVAKTVTEIHTGIIVSAVVVNKRWFDALPADVQAAILAAGAKADKEIATESAGINARADEAWVKNGGEIIKLAPAEQAKMMSELKVLGTKLLSQNPQVKAEYDELLKTADKYK